MSIEELIEKLSQYATGDEFQKPIEDAVELLKSIQQQEPVAWLMRNKAHGLEPSLHFAPKEGWHITWEAIPLYSDPMPDDALREMIAKAGKVMRERAARVAYDLWVMRKDQKYTDDAIRSLPGVTLEELK